MKNKVIKTIFVSLLSIIPIQSIVNSHENHDHAIYNWPVTKSKTQRTEKSDHKQSKFINRIKNIWNKNFNTYKKNS